MRQYKHPILFSVVVCHVIFQSVDFEAVISSMGPDISGRMEDALSHRIGNNSQIATTLVRSGEH